MDVLLTVFLGIFEDLNLVLKIFVLLTIYSFVTNHLGKGPVAIAIILGMAWFIFFNFWALFGGVYVLYTLLVMGVSGILIDFFFVSQMGGKPQEGPSPIDSGKDVAGRQAAIAGRMGGGGPPGLG